MAKKPIEDKVAKNTKVAASKKTTAKSTTAKKTTAKNRKKLEKSVSIQRISAEAKHPRAAHGNC